MLSCRPAVSGRVVGGTRRAALVAVLALATMLVPEAAAPSAAADPTDAELRERKESLEAEQEELESGLEQTEAERERVAEELSSATQRVERLRARLAELESKAERLTAEIDELEARAARSQERMGERVTELYKRAGQSDVAGLLAGESPADLAGRSHYLVALSRDDREIFEVASAQNTRLARRREELDETSAEVAEVTEQARLAQEQLQEGLAEAGAAADEARSRMARVEAAGNKVEERLEERARVAKAQAANDEPAESDTRVAGAADEGAGGGADAEAGEAEVSADAGTEGAEASAETDAGEAEVSTGGGSDAEADAGGGGMACPQARPRSYSDTWGAPRSGGRSHEGTDIFGQMGGDVFAVTDGVIEWTRRGSSAGLWLSLRGDDGHRYWYMHLSDFAASAGQRVSAGQRIASNGNTGNARGTSPHIHFEYHPGGGGPVNPYPLVRRICG